MDDLISREAVKKRIWDLIIEKDVDDIPSAFEGMTNRDVLKALFPIDENKGARLTKVYLDYEAIESFALTTTQKWLDSPYKGVSE